MTAKNMIAVAMQVDNIWIPPEGRPYWIGGLNVGPHLTDVELDTHDMSRFKKYPFDKIWAESCRLSSGKRVRY